MRWMRNHSGRRMQTENLKELFNEAYLRAAGKRFRQQKLYFKLITIRIFILPQIEFIKNLL